MAYDSDRHVTVLFGGLPPVPGETWEWDGLHWKRQSTRGPAARIEHAMAYDSNRHVTVLFGGALNGSSQPSGETWEWDGQTWTLRATVGPPPRWNHCMDFDPVRGVTVLFGGTIDNSTAMGDLWEWNGQTWTQRHETGPLPRHSFAMTFDSRRSRILLHGGMRFVPGQGNLFFSDLWEWNGTAWLQRPYDPANGPWYAFRHVMTYDTVRRVALMMTEPGFMWEWNGSTWYKRPVSGSPGGGDFSAMAYDSARQVPILWWGGGSSETWEFAINSECPGDINHDGHINVDDLVILITSWGSCRSAACPGDLNHDGSVDMSDLTMLISQWT
jgi:hypothetical protein